VAKAPSNAARLAWGYQRDAARSGLAGHDGQGTDDPGRHLSTRVVGDLERPRQPYALQTETLSRGYSRQSGRPASRPRRAALPGGRDRVPRQPPASKARLPTLARDRCSGGPEADLARRLGGRRPPVARRVAAVGRAVARSLPRLPNLQHLARLLAGVLSHGFVGRRPDQADQVIGLEHEDPGHEPDQSSPVRRHLFLRGPSSRPTMAGPR
jgi:hypothetical protein